MREGRFFPKPPVQPFPGRDQGRRVGGHPQPRQRLLGCLPGGESAAPDAAAPPVKPGRQLHRQVPAAVPSLPAPRSAAPQPPAHHRIAAPAPAIDTPLRAHEQPPHITCPLDSGKCARRCQRYKKGALRWREKGSGRRITDYRGRNLPAPEKPQTWIAPALRAKLAVRYEAGATVRKLVAWPGAHGETAVRHLVRAGVEFRRVGLTAEESAKATRMYLDGLTRVEIAASYDVAASTIHSCLLRQGVSMRPPSRRHVMAS
jgi:Ni/Co efflux regulator RcnB